jgi:predicted DNA-binding transcriptional regulator AlpA
MSTNTEYVTRSKMARILGVHPNTLDNLRKRNQGPPYVRLGNRLIRYPLQSSDATKQAQG